MRVYDKEKRKPKLLIVLIVILIERISLITSTFEEHTTE